MIRITPLSWILLAVLSSIAPIGTAAAAIRPVCPACSYTTLTAAIQDSDPGDTISLLFTAPHTEVGINVDRDLIIEGLQRETSIVQAAAFSGSGNGGVFIVLDGVSVTMRDLTIRHGDSQGIGGGLEIKSSSDPNSVVTLERVDLVGNHAEIAGGGIYNAATLHISDFSLRRNRAQHPSFGAFGGAGIFNEGTVVMKNGDIDNNFSSDEGGGIRNSSFSVGSDMTLEDVRIEDNQALDGGGIHNAGSLSIVGGNISRNTANSERGGGMYNASFNPSTVTINDTRIDFNTLNTASSGSLPAGAGIYTASPMTLDRVALTQNTPLNPFAITRGGGLYIDSTTVELIESHVTFNGGYLGGGIYQFAGQLTVNRSSIRGNTATGGGGLFLDNGNTDLTNVTIESNTADQNGGGVHQCNGDLSFSNDTITRNVANVDAIGSGEGGGVYVSCPNATTSLRSSIIANNDALGGDYPDCLGGFSSGSFSLIENTGPLFGTACAINATFTAGMLYNVSPIFGGAEGTGFERSISLLAGSPAIDSGSCSGAMGEPLISDQRNFGMPVDGDFDNVEDCDMGSYEYLAVPEPGFVGGLAICLGLLATMRGQRTSALTVSRNAVS